MVFDKYNKPAEVFEDVPPLARSFTVKTTIPQHLSDNCNADLQRLLNLARTTSHSTTKVKRGSLRPQHLFQCPRKWSLDSSASVTSSKRNFLLKEVPSKSQFSPTEEVWVLNHANNRLRRHLIEIDHQPPSYNKPTSTWEHRIARPDPPKTSLFPFPKEKKQKNQAKQGEKTDESSMQHHHGGGSDVHELPTAKTDLTAVAQAAQQAEPKGLPESTQGMLHMVDEMLDKMSSLEKYPHPLGMPRWFREKLDRRQHNASHGHSAPDQCARCGRNMCLTCGINSRRHQRAEHSK